MRKNVFGRQLGRDTNERKGLFRNLASELVLHEHIETTEAKAKAVRPYVEQLVTKAIKGGVANTRFIRPYVTEEALTKLLNDFSRRFAHRRGGYTRIIRLGQRLGDNAQMVILEWTEKAELGIKNNELRGETKKPAGKDSKEKKKQ